MADFWMGGPTTGPVFRRLLRLTAGQQALASQRASELYQEMSRSLVGTSLSKKVNACWKQAIDEVEASQ